MRSDVKDLNGKIFGKLTAKSPLVKNNRTYWLCECLCGVRKEVRSDALISGKTGNCGCDTSRLISEANTLPGGQAHINLALHFYRKSAKDKGRPFDLTKEQFVSIMSRDCSYCGVSPTAKDSPYVRNNLMSIHPMNGIDRIDSSLGYTLDNSAPCCSRCNQIKMDMDLGEFIQHVHKIVCHHKKIGIGGYIVGRTGEKIIQTHKANKPE